MGTTLPLPQTCPTNLANVDLKVFALWIKGESWPPWKTGCHQEKDLQRLNDINGISEPNSPSHWKKTPLPAAELVKFRCMSYSAKAKCDGAVFSRNRAAPSLQFLENHPVENWLPAKLPQLGKIEVCENPKRDPSESWVWESLPQASFLSVCITTSLENGQSRPN